MSSEKHHEENLVRHGPRIEFQDPTDRPEGTRSGRARRLSRSSSISSATSRNEVAGLAIEYRTLSFQVSDSQSKAQHTQLTEPLEDKDEDYFAKLLYHSLSGKEVCDRFNVLSSQGLSVRAVSTRMAQHGKNEIPAPPQNYAKKIFWYVFGGFCSILWIGVIIFFICWRPLGDPHPQAYNLGLAILVLIVILLQASFSAFQDWSTQRTMKSILDLLPADAHVLREGKNVTVPSTDLVPGDIVRISIGQKVPADLRLLSSSEDVRFDRSMLTGEAEEVDGSLVQTDENFLESRNIALMGTMVTNGDASGIVILTGKRSVMGRISAATTSVKEEATLIQKEISRFVRIIVVLTFFLACLLLFTWVGWLRTDHKGFMNVVGMLNDVMGCVVAFIPEGMPVGVALTLMIVARRMKAVNVLPKGLSTVETLGCVDVICSDKTGTLTQNQMVVTSVAFLDCLQTVEEVYNISERPAAIRELCKASALCIDAIFDPVTNHLPVSERSIQGNATDGAVLRFAKTMVPDQLTEDAYPRVFHVPFNSKNKWMLSAHKDMDAGNEKTDLMVYVKGAPDILLPMCSYWLSSDDGEAKPLDETATMNLQKIQEQLSRQAERVLMICSRRYVPIAPVGSNALSSEMQDQALQDLVIIGLFGILDPPRPESAQTVADCRKAGVKFFMVTGDFGLTGAAIARRIGIYTDDIDPDRIEDILASSSSHPGDDRKSMQSLLLHGSELDGMSKQDWDTVCQYQEIVFGRTAPEHKLRIVKELQLRGHTVAVTGDGVNDAPALRASDVGIAVVSGSDVALEAADLVLLGSFSSIIDSIRLGRLVFQNLQKVISYLLPAGSWSEIWPVLMNVFFGVPLPLSSFLMIIICVFTDLFCSMSLIMEHEEFDLLSLPPRNPKKDHLINFKIYAQSYLFIGVLETLCAHSMFFLYMYRQAGIPFGDLIFAFERYSNGFHGYDDDQLAHFNTVGQSVYFVTLVILQWGNIVSIRNKRLSILQADPIRKKRRNPYLLWSILISLTIAIFVTEVPGIQSLFGTASVPIDFWLYPLPLAVGILFMDETRKALVRAFPKGPIAKIAW